MKARMLFLIIAVAVLAVFASARDGRAFNMGLPDVYFDTVPMGNSGGLSYNASNGDLTVLGRLMSLTNLPGPTTSYPGGTVSYTMNLNSVSSLGGLTTGYFGTSLLSNDLVIVDGTSTILLTGEFISAEIAGLNGFNMGSGSARFSITGGLLASDFMAPCSGQNCGGMVNISFNLSTGFSSSMFSTNFKGESKGHIATVPVPEPATLLLLGGGLVGAGLWIRKRR